MRALLRKAIPRMRNIAIAGAFRTWKQATERSKRENLANTVGDNSVRFHFYMTFRVDLALLSCTRELIKSEIDALSADTAACCIFCPS